jgi:hypothetical protein
MSLRVDAVLLAGVAAMLLSAGCSKPSYRDANAAEEGPTIAGRIVAPDGVLPPGAIVTARSVGDDRSGSGPIPTKADGRFLTPPLWPGTYVLRVQRTPPSTGPGSLMGLTIVPVKTEDVTGVTITLQRDVSLTGHFRMESDNPAARWPTHIHVLALLVVDGVTVPDGNIGDGASGGRFMLRNPIGPRVLRSGYSTEAGHSWWPSRVLLDGMDVTNVPTDFSLHAGSRLEVVFTQHPARLAGTVEDGKGQPIPDAWIIACAADGVPCASWASTTHIVRADAKGAFRIATLPGRYVLRAFAATAFSSRDDARRELTNLVAGGVPADVEDRRVAQLRLGVR